MGGGGSVAGIAGLLRVIFKGRDDGWRARSRRAMRRSAPPPEPTGPVAPALPEGFTDVLGSDEIADGEVVEVFVDGDPVAVCRVGGQLHALSGICPHAQGPLGDGLLDGTTLTCPVHGWSFDVRDGACQVDPSQPAPTYPIVERDGRIAVGSVMAPGRTEPGGS